MMAYEVKEAKELVIKAGRKLLESGLIARTWGNISARISQEQFVITPSGRDYESLTPKDIVCVNIADASYEGKIKPSSEKGVHAEGYRLRPDVDFIVHTHQRHASALSILGETLTGWDREDPSDAGILGTKVPCAAYGLSASEAITQNVSHAIASHPNSRAVLMKYHGALCLGRDFEDAFAIAHALENVAGRLYEKRVGEIIPKTDPILRYEIDLAALGLQNFYSMKNSTDRAVCLFTDAPFIKKMSSYGLPMQPYLDDLAQIAGTCIGCVAQDATEKEIKDALSDASAVMIQNKGALCFGINSSEAEAVCMVLEKGAQAAYLAHVLGEISPVDPVSAKMDRSVYVKSYVKLR